MADERAASQNEAGERPAQVPPQVRVRRVGPAVRVPARVLGRLVNRLDACHWFTSLPADVRVNLFEMLCQDGDWTPPDQVENIFGPPICDGSPDHCVEHDAENAAFDLLESQPLPVSNIINIAFVPGDIATLADQLRQLGWPTDDHPQTIYNRIVNFVEEMEHKLHSYGVKLTAREGKSIARIHLARYLLTLSIAFLVPVTDAAPLGRSSWADFSHVLPTFFRLLYGDLVSAHKALEHDVQLRYRCRYYVSLATRAQIAGACAQGVLSGPVCKDFYQLSGNLPSYSAYNMPIERCSYEFESSPWLVFFFNILLCLSLGFVAFLAFKVLKVGLKFVFRSAVLLAGLLISLVRLILVTVRSLRLRFAFSRDVALVRVAEVSSEVKGKPNETNHFFKMVGSTVKSLALLEMSMPGSEIRISGVVPGCLHLAVLYEKKVTFVGMGFRYGEYFVTAQHNIHAMTSCPGKYYLIPFRPDRKNEICELGMDKMLELTPEILDRDLVGDEFDGYDVSVIPISPASWSTMAVKSLDHSDAVWNSNVTVYGLEKSGKHKLQRSLGAVVKREDDPLHVLFYTASTLKGWSGSPVLSGHRKVVAIHCGTDGEVNHGLNFIVVRFIIDYHESRTRENSEDVERHKILKSSRGRAGRLAIRQEELEFERAEDEAIDKFKVYMQQAKNGQVWFSAEEDVARANASHATWPVLGQSDWADESAISPPMQKPTVVIESKESDPAPTTPRRECLFSYAAGAPFVVEQTDIRLSAPHYKGRPSDYERYIDLQEAKELGYDPATFGMPRATDRKSAISRSKNSLSTSLAEAVDVRLNAERPSEILRYEAKSILVELLASLKYPVDGEGVTIQKIESQLNSSVVACSKSPGLPYVVEDKVSTNAELLFKYGVPELAQSVYSRYKRGNWEQPSVNFLKIEPTKVEKLDKGLDRCVQAVGLDAQLIFRCLFGTLGDVAAEQYKRNPIMCGWSPLKPGDGEFLFSALDKGAKKAKNKVFEYDGQAFEFVAHTEEAYSDVTDVIVALGVPGSKTSVEQMKLWREEARSFMDAMGRSGYQMADGTLVRKLVPFVLNSGRWDTFLRNSVTGLYWMIIGLLESGYSLEDIRKDFVIKVGGDDAIVSVPRNFDPTPFQQSLRKYGMRIHKISLKDIEDGFEFFSWRFSKTDSGLVQWEPTRFTKHIENLLNCAHELRPQALLSHMMNWAHSTKHYEFFRKTYMRGYEMGDSGYELRVLPRREDLLYHFRGMEAMHREPGIVEEFLKRATST